MPSFAWLDDSIEHSDYDTSRATALAKKWTALTSAEEQRIWRVQARTESDNFYGSDACEDCEACAAGDYEECQWIKDGLVQEQQRMAECDLEVELIEDKLKVIGARIMRPYEHYNEDERYMQYMESDRD